jgi:protein-export membrane protein SecD
VRKGRLVAGLVACVVVVAALWTFIAVRGLRPQLGLDLQGGVSITLVPAEGQQVDDAVLDQTVAIIRQRVDALGVAEPEIARQGDTIIVQLPGVADQQRAQEVIGRTAQLQFRPVLEILGPDSPGYAEAGPPCGQLQEGTPPPDEEVVLCEGATAGGTDPAAGPLPPEQRAKYRLGPVAVSGDEVSDASATLPPGGTTWQVDLDLEGEGVEDFRRITGELACAPVGSPNRQLAIVLDDVVESAPPMATDIVCDQGIGNGQAVITVGGAEQEARQLALVLRTGALPIELDFATSQSVSPTLGQDSLRAGLLAGAIGLALVALYLIALYRGIGVAAVLELVMFGLVTGAITLLLSAYAGFTLTLAGIAGFIVSIGIAADSSIIYRERYRDELRAGRTVRTAADHAFSSSFRTNLAGNAVSFLAAAVLYLLAVGPVRGFAFTLGLSTLVDTLLLATFTRSLFGLLARSPRLAKSSWMGLRAAPVPAETAQERKGSLV